MGRDICCISKHNFTFNNVDKLMLELSERFNANVFHVFASHINLDEYLERIDHYDLKHGIDVNGYIIQKHIISPDAPNLTIEHDDYMYKFLQLQFGEEAGNHPEFKANWGEDVMENNKTIQWFIDEINTLSIYFQDFGLWMSKELAEITHDNYFGRWWDLFETLIEGDEHNRTARFLNYRNRNVEIARMIGGTDAYYIDDQSSQTGIGQGNQWDMTWAEVQKELNSGKVKENMIDLVKLLSDTSYYNKITALAKKSPKEYSVFYDDFSVITIGKH